MPFIGINSFALFATINGLVLVLLPAQLAGIDPANKVTNLAIVNTAALVVAIVAQPLMGAFSDRTRSRLGRRAPWMIGGAILVLAALLVIGYLPSVGTVVVFWLLAQIGINAVQGPLTAVIPDRYSALRRGLPSSLLGFGTLLGAAIGAVVGGQLATNVALGYTVFGVLFFVATILFVLVNRDRSSTTLVQTPLTAREFLSSFWVSPRTNPDFAWAFAARLVFYIGFFSSFSVQLFVLTDYIRLSLKDAGAQVSINNAISLPGMIIGLVAAGLISDRIGRRKIFIYLAGLFVFVSLASPLLMPTVQGVMLGAILNGIGFGLYLSSDTALLTLVLPGGGVAAAKDLGILNIATILPQTLASVIAAIIIANFGGYAGLFVFGMVFIVIASLLLIPIKSVK